jgi:predicted GIY-YIG superfamily endonuclease
MALDRETLENRIIQRCGSEYEFLNWSNPENISTIGKIKLNCKIHGEFEIIYSNFVTGNKSGCKQCGRENNWLSHLLDENTALQNILEKCKTRNYKFLNFNNKENEYQGAKTKLKLWCNNCNQEWNTSNYNDFINNDTGCPNCIKYSFDEINTIANQYISLSEFRKNNPNAYDKASKSGWLYDPNFFKLNRQNEYTEYSDRLIYAYFFEIDNIKYIYVGLTSNIKRRHWEHQQYNSAVYQFAQKNNLQQIPDPVILTELMEAKSAAIEESVQLEKYVNLGYRKINKTGTGSLGAYSY